MFTAIDAARALWAADAVVGSTLLTARERVDLLTELARSIPTLSAAPRSAAAVKAAIERAQEPTDDKHDTAEAGAGTAEGVAEQAEEPRPVHRKGAGRSKRPVAADQG